MGGTVEALRGRGGEKKGERRPARPAVWKPAAAENKLLGCRPGFDAEVKLSINSNNSELPPQRCAEQSGSI